MTSRFLGPVLLIGTLFFAQLANASAHMTNGVPTPRALLATSEIPYTQEELDGVMAFAKEHQIDLSAPIDLKVTENTLMIGKTKTVFNPQNHTINCNGTVVKASSQPLDIRVREIYSRLTSTSHASLISLLIPQATAVEKLGNKVTDAGVIAVIVGFIAPAITDDEFVAKASKWIMRGGFVGIVAGLILDVFDPEPAAAATFPTIVHASCDGGGLQSEDQNGNILNIDKKGSKLVILGRKKGSSIKDYSNEHRSPAETKQLEAMLQDCSKSPHSEKDLVRELNNSMRTDYKMVAANGNYTPHQAQPAKSAH